MEERMKKCGRLAALLLAAACILGAGGGVRALAAPKLEQVYINSPTIRTYLTGAEQSLAEGFSNPEFLFGGDALSYNGDAHTYDPEQDGGTEYVYAVENSRFVTKKQREEIGKSLREAVKRLRSGETLTVYTFGDKFSASEPVSVGFQASDEQKTEAGKQIADLLKAEEKTSHLWNAVTNVADQFEKEEAGGPNRRVAVFVTGGNYKVSTSNNDEEDVRARLGKSPRNAAYYMIQLRTKSKIDGSEASVFTQSGGEKYSEKAEGGIGQCFAKLWDAIDQTCVATFQASDSTAFGEAGAVTMRVNGETVCEDRQVAAASAWQDNPAVPVLVPMTEGGTDYIKKEDEHTISFAFSEPVRGAEVIKNYGLTRGNGIRLTIKSLKYDVKTYRCVIVLEQDIFTDRYELTLSNITDIDHSPAAVEPASVSFSMEGKDERVYNFLQFLKSYWWIILIAVAVAILLIAYAVVRSHGGIVEQADGRKGFANATTVTVGISTPKTKKIALNMTDAYGKSTEIICHIDSSIFVGRDKMCQIHTDDDKMSRQHFAIEADQLGYYITDLDTLNGTTVNGVKLTSRQMLKDGDVIAAGREKFVFSQYRGAKEE